MGVVDEGRMTEQALGVSGKIDVRDMATHEHEKRALTLLGPLTSSIRY